MSADAVTYNDNVVIVVVVVVGALPLAAFLEAAVVVVVVAALWAWGPTLWADSVLGINEFDIMTF